MPLSTQEKCLILAIAVLLLLYFMNKNNNSQNPVEHMTTDNQQDTPNQEIVSALDELVAQSENSDLSENTLKQKMTGKNHAVSGEKEVNYSANRESNNSDGALDDFFMKGNTVTNIDNFVGPFKPMHERNVSGDLYAPYQESGDKKKKDVFDLDNYLPQQVNEDWFDNVPEPISVKNRHLINISKQVGVTTIGSSHKNATHDIRGDEYCPKFIVSPWMQSSIDPDTSLVGLCGKN